MSFHIRKLDSSDLHLLLDIAERTFRIAWEAENDPFHFENYCKQTFTEEKFSAELAHSHSEFYFIEEFDVPIGYLKLNFDQTRPGIEDDSCVQLERIYIETDYQGKGLGEKFLKLAHQRAIEVQAQRLWLSVWKKAPRSIKFYQRHGYEIFGEEIFWVGDDPQVDWLMRRGV